MSGARRYVVDGLVQGVGFRWFTHRVATRLGIRGSVANLPDGSVEVLADGDADAMSQLERELRTGPSGARVDRLDASPHPPIRELGFRIRQA
jgi:acylphosphatase